MKKITSFVLTLVVLTSFCAAPGMASDGTWGDYGRGMAEKAGRGLWNIVSSPAEIPCRIATDYAVDPVKGSLTGTGKGLFWMVRRLWNGVTEFATFVMPAEATMPPVCQAD